MAAAKAPNRRSEPKFPVAMPRGAVTGHPSPPAPKSPDGITALARKSITSMSDEEIIQENLNEILELKSRKGRIAYSPENAFSAYDSASASGDDPVVASSLIFDVPLQEERKANGRLVAVIVCFLVLFLAVYHACVRKSENSLAGVLVPAGIMLSYGAWVAVLAKRDKHRRAMFERHIEEVALKNKIELEEKHARHAKHSHAHPHHGHSGTDSTGSASSTLQFVNELLPNGEHRKKQRRHRHKERSGEREEHQHLEVGVHRGTPKRPSFRQKLFGQTIAHVKLVEAQSDSTDSAGGPGPGPGPGSRPPRSTSSRQPDPSAQAHPGEQRPRLQPQVVRVSSVP
ncbi:uncharacterized protein LOC108023907 isoform X1 [Drosophila biarmipes]|uniref:uncharacterized protein LOC108023907 isoform X1 n=1 Tax=Drosophila biarmipes TaxID=125945 RepID=UPI0021CCA07A|nr:uncharacterized protein LOC108023907 isoform X1 [Drosophila biarmipes]